MKTNIKQDKTKIIIKFSVVVTLIIALISTSLSSIFNTSAVSYTNPEDVTGNGAKAMLIANVFKKCISHIYKLSDVSGMVAMPWNDLMASWDNTYKSSNWYSDADTTKIGAGVYGKVRHPITDESHFTQFLSLPLNLLNREFCFILLVLLAIFPYVRFCSLNFENSYA